MAEQLTVGELVYKISGDMDNLKTELAKAETEIGKLRGSMDQTSQSSDSMSSMLGKAATVVKTFAAAFIVKQIIDFGRAAVDMASQQLEQQTKLYQVLRTSQNATDDQIKSLIDQANALEQVGVISKDVTIAAQAQLATFDLSTDSIRQLTPSILDYLAAEKGMNATQGDAIGLTNSLAQALQGNFKALTASGFVLDDATKKLIEHGTQEERVQALTEVLDSTYKDYNKTLGDTFLGTQARVQNLVQDFTSDLGFALMPAIQNVEQAFIGWISGIQDGDKTLQAGADRINFFGRMFYQASHFIIGAGVILRGLVKYIANSLSIYGDAANVILAFGKDASNIWEKYGGGVREVISDVTGYLKAFGTFVGNVFKTVAGVMVKFGELTGKALHIDLSGFAKSISDYANDTVDSLKKSTTAWTEENMPNTIAALEQYHKKQNETLTDIIDTAKEAQGYFEKGWSGEGYKPVTAAALQAYDAMKKPVDSFKDTGNEAKKTADELSKFQEKLLDIVKASQDASKELTGDLAKSFKDFGDGVKDQIAESTKGLADIVVDAQKKIADLNKQIAASKDDANADALKARETLNEKIAAADLALSDRLRKIDEKSKTAQKQRDEAQLLHTRALADAQADYSKSTKGIDTTGADKLTDLKSQQAKQQKILDSAAGYAERQATFIQGLRDKITGAGIDLTTTGLDSVLKAQDLQTQIDEANRKASLNDFQRFEEEQNQKLTILANNFITEVTLISQKIAKQKAYEQDLTSFLSGMNADRLKDTDTWAQATIAKYGEVAASLENIISLQARAGQVAAMNAAQASNGAAGGNTTNNKTVNAPITINATNATQVDYNVIAKQIGFQTAK